MRIQEMDPPAVATTASKIYEKSLSLESIVNNENDSTIHNPLFGLLQHLGRYRVWSENIGAHRKGRVSLDYRLRNAARMRQTVVNLLNDLHESIQNGTLKLCFADSRSLNR